MFEQQNNELENSTLNITFNNHIKNIDVKLSCDAFKSALQNIFNNACQVADNAININIDLDIDTSERIQLKITDDGPGIPDSVKSRVFEPFITTRVNGTGLGLAVVDAVVRANKGGITVEDDHESGTCFTICLPVYKSTSKT